MTPNTQQQRIWNPSFVILLVLTCVAAGAVALIKGPDRLLDIVWQFLGFLFVLTPKILCGFFIAAATSLLVPKSTLQDWIGDGSGLRGLCVATLAGALFPGGPTAIFALAAGFRAAGAGMGTLIAFVVSWSLLGLNRTVIWEMSFLHIDVVAQRIVICLPIPIVVGWIASRVMR